MPTVLARRGGSRAILLVAIDENIGREVFLTRRMVGPARPLQHLSARHSWTVCRVSDEWQAQVEGLVAGVPDGRWDFGEWVEADHPRDESGRFSEKGETAPARDPRGRAVPAAPTAEQREGIIRDALDRFQLNRVDVERLEGQYRKAPTEIERDCAVWLAIGQAAADAARAHGTTKTLNMDPRTGGYTDERKAIHRDIIRRMMREQTERFGAEPPSNLEHPSVVFILGMTGAGKSEQVREKLDESKAVYVDPDKVKEYIPEYNQLNAAFVQQESGDIADELMKYAAKRRMNVIMEGTGKTSGALRSDFDDGLQGKLSEFKDMGYRTEVRFVDVTADQSIERSVRRFVASYVEKGNGRFVPPDIIRGTGKHGLSLSPDDDKRHYGTKPRATFESVHEQYRSLDGPDGRPLRRANGEMIQEPMVDAWLWVNGWTGREVGRRGDLRGIG